MNWKYVVLLCGGAFTGVFLSALWHSMMHKDRVPRPKEYLPHLVIDLETLGTVPGSVILSIGAVFVDLVEETTGEPFYIRVDIEDSKRHGLIEMGSTRQWWEKQDGQAAYEALRHPERVPLDKALEQFARFVRRESSNVQVWGNGSDFDNALLAVAYYKVGQALPWAYWNNRCLRTLRHQHSDVLVRRADDTPHHAMYDALHQAEILLALHRKGVVA